MKVEEDQPTAHSPELSWRATPPEESHSCQMKPGATRFAKKTQQLTINNREGGGWKGGVEVVCEMRKKKTCSVYSPLCQVRRLHTTEKKHMLKFEGSSTCFCTGIC